MEGRLRLRNFSLYPNLSEDQLSSSEVLSFLGEDDSKTALLDVLTLLNNKFICEHII